MSVKRRILHKIKIDEISGVDNPCQEHARMMIMKRASPDDAAADRLAVLKSKIVGLTDGVSVLSKNTASIEGVTHVPRYISRNKRKKQLADQIEKLKADIESFAKR